MPLTRVPAIVVPGVLALATAAGCTLPGRPAGPPTRTGTPGATSSATDPAAAVDARGQLAIRAAAAKDRRYVATYRLTVSGRPARTMTVIVANDGNWQVYLPGGAMSGTVDVAIAQTGDGLYQCALGAAPACVKVAPRGGHLPASVDPRVQHLFTDWLDPLTDTDAAISVAATRPLPGVQGACYSVESNSASLAVPVDPGVYCYLPDGTLTGAAVGFGTVVLSGAPAPPPPVAALPGPVTTGSPLPVVAPPPASPAATASPGQRP